MRQLALTRQQPTGAMSHDDHEAFASDLSRIRADLRRLAADTDEVRKIIEPLLWDEPSKTDGA